MLPESSRRSPSTPPRAGAEAPRVVEFDRGLSGRQRIVHVLEVGPEPGGQVLGHDMQPGQAPDMTADAPPVVARENRRRGPRAQVLPLRLHRLGCCWKLDGVRRASAHRLFVSRRQPRDVVEAARSDEVIASPVQPHLQRRRLVRVRQSHAEPLGRPGRARQGRPGDRRRPTGGQELAADLGLAVARRERPGLPDHRPVGVVLTDRARRVGGASRARLGLAVDEHEQAPGVFVWVVHRE